MAGEGIPLEDYLKNRAGVGEQPPPTFAQRAVSAVATPLTNIATQGLSTILDTGLSPYNMDALSRTIAETAIPQTPTDVLTTAGTVAAGLATGGMGPLGAAAMRTGGSMVGSGAGALLEGKSPMEAVNQVGWTGLLTSAMEGIGFGLGKLWRGTAAGRRAIANTRQDDVALQISTYVPGLDQFKNAADLKRAILSRAENSPKLQMDDRLLAAIGKVDDLIGNNKINVPALATEQLPTRSFVPQGPAPMTLRDAIEELKNRAQAAYAGAQGLPATRTHVGSEARGEWKDAIGEIKAELMRLNPTGEAAALFESSRREWAVGNALLRTLPDAFKGYPNYVEFDLNRVRQLYEKSYSKFERSFAPGEREAFEKILYQGGLFGSRDALPGQPGMAAAASQLLRQGGGTGTVGTLPVRTLFPNLGAQYTHGPGQAPLSLPGSVQTGLDALLQKFGGAGLSPPTQ